MGNEKGQPYTASESDNRGNTERVDCRAVFLNLLECQRSFPPAQKKEFCSTRCKDAYHKAAHEMGTAAIEGMKKKRRQHFARYEDSARLQAMCEYLRQVKGWRSALEIMKGTGFKVQAVGSAASELRRNAEERGIDCNVECDRSSNKYRYVPKPVVIKDQDDFFLNRLLRAGGE